MRTPSISAVIVLLSLSACADGAPPAVPSTDAWEAPRELPDSGGTAVRATRLADLRAVPGGSLHALLVRDPGDGGAMRLLYAEFDGARWHPPVALDDGGEIVGPAQLAVAAGGEVHVAWIGGRVPAGPTQTVPLTEVRHRMRGAGRWSPVERLFVAAGGIDTGASGLAVAEVDGVVHVVHPGANDEFVDRVRTSGRWDSLPAGRTGGEPRLVSGPGGALAMVELKSEMAPGEMSGGTMRADPWIRFLRDGRWTAPSRISRSPGTASHKPQLAWAASGTLLAVWLEAVGAELLPSRLLYARSANGARWSEPVELAAGVPGRVFYAPRLVADGGGVIHLTFARFRTDLVDPHHFHMRLRDGAWSPPAEIRAGDGARQSEMESAVDWNGRLNVVWIDGGGRVLHTTPRADSAVAVPRGGA